MAKPVFISPHLSWPTISAAKAHFSAILGRYADGDRVTDASDQDDLLALLKKYDQGLSADQAKGGIGVGHFFKARDEAHYGMTSCFHVRRLDGTAVDFSIHRAVEHAAR